MTLVERLRDDKEAENTDPYWLMMDRHEAADRIEVLEGMLSKICSLATYSAVRPEPGFVIGSLTFFNAIREAQAYLVTQFSPTAAPTPDRPGSAP